MINHQNFNYNDVNQLDMNSAKHQFCTKEKDKSFVFVFLNVGAWYLLPVHCPLELRCWKLHCCQSLGYQ